MYYLYNSDLVGTSRLKCLNIFILAIFTTIKVWINFQCSIMLFTEKNSWSNRTLIRQIRILFFIEYQIRHRVNSSRTRNPQSKHVEFCTVLWTICHRYVHLSTFLIRSISSRCRGGEVHIKSWCFFKLKNR